jgi:hypothetical protein
MPILKNLPRFRSLNFVQVENRYRRKPDGPKYEPPISVKFPYRLIELLAPYQQFERQSGHTEFSRAETINAELRKTWKKKRDGRSPYSAKSWDRTG